jgi:putative aldouronate transport system permease protein
MEQAATKGKRKRQKEVKEKLDFKTLIKRIIRYKEFYIMFMPVMLFFIVFHYIPMLGIKMAFYIYKYVPAKKAFAMTEFIGLKNFEQLLTSPTFFKVFANTVIISLCNLAIGLVVAVGFALLLNELKTGIFKKSIQTISYLPHFLSWVVVASIFTMLLSPQNGIVNAIITKLGGEPIFFMASNQWWRKIFYTSYVWKNMGWSTIIYLSALTSIDPTLYEASSIDGAGRIRQTISITLPSILTTILVVLILDLSKVLNIFEPIFVMMNAMVYDVADVIGTYTYRIGLLKADYSYSTAVGLFKSLIAMVLVLGANKLSTKIKGESIL